MGQAFHVMQQEDRARQIAQAGQCRLEFSYAVPPMCDRLGIGFTIIDQLITQGIMRTGAAYLVAPVAVTGDVEGRGEQIAARVILDRTQLLLPPDAQEYLEAVIDVLRRTDVTAQELAEFPIIRGEPALDTRPTNRGRDTSGISAVMMARSSFTKTGAPSDSFGQKATLKGPMMRPVGQ